MLRMLFVLYLVVEIAALWAVSATVGVGWALLLLMLSSALGVVAFSTQTRRVFRAVFARSSPSSGGSGPRTASAALADGSVSAIAVALLLVPGLVTGVLGLLLLFPPTRTVVRPLVLKAGLGRLSRVVGVRGSMTGPSVVDGEVVGDGRTGRASRGTPPGPTDGTAPPGFFPPSLPPASHHGDR